MIRPSLIVLLAMLSACASYSTHVSPAPTPKGETILGANLDVINVTRRRRSVTIPNLEMTLRYGVSDKVDVGGKINMFGAEFNAKVSLLSGPIDIALLPGAGLGIGALANDNNRAFMTWFLLPILFGVDIGEMQAILSLKPLVQAAAGSGIDGSELITGDLVLLPGAGFGVRLPIGDLITLFPEINAHFPYAYDKSRWLDVVWQGGIAFQVAVTL